jgi:hypothetical protein
MPQSRTPQFNWTLYSFYFVRMHLSNHSSFTLVYLDQHTQPLSDDESSVRATIRSDETVHTTVPAVVRRRKSNDVTVLYLAVP